MPDQRAALTWDEVIQTCSRLHTTRTREMWPGAGPDEMREDSQMLDIWLGDTPAVIVPTRMHEPGFYVRYADQTPPNDIIRDETALMGWFRDACHAGSVARRG